jgi:acetylornithine/succinyldiaminopimelate/putrescine aminotransferase
MDSKTLMELSQKVVANTYNRYALVPVRGKGTRLWDVEGREYLDFVSGLAVCNLGHCHPKVVKAIQDQAEKLIHVSNFYYIEPQIRLSSLLCEHSFADKVFFCNSGAEANEGAIKLPVSMPRIRWKEIVTRSSPWNGRSTGEPWPR